MSKPGRKLFTLVALLVVSAVNFQGTSAAALVKASTAPTITAISPTNVNAGSATFTLSITGTNFVAGSTTVVWSGSVSGSLAANVVNSSSLTATIPASLLTAAGTAKIYVSVSGRAGGNSNQVSFTINAVAGGTGGTGGTTNPLAITTTSVPAGTQGAAYSASLAASGGTSPYTWTASTALPAGLTLATTGAISGTPSASGSFSFSAQVKDSAAATVSVTLPITIGASAVTISVAPASLANGTAGTPYSASLSGSGGTSPYTFALASGSTLPAGLTLSSAGAISGTPTNANSYSFSITAADSASHTATKAYTMTVGAATAGGILFQTGFEAGDPPVDYVFPSSDISVTSTPPPGLVGNALMIHYHICGNPNTPPGLAQLAAGNLPQQAVYVKYTYVNVTGQSGPSSEAAVTILANNVINVTSPPPSIGMTAYNVYAATAAGAEVLQNATPIPIGTDWTGALTGLVTGTAAPPTTNAAGCGGQNQDHNRWVSKVITPGMNDVYVKTYVYFQNNPGGSTSGTSGEQRKIIWIGDSTTASNNVGNNYQLVLNSYTSSGGVPSPTINLVLMGQATPNVGCFFSSWQTNSFYKGLNWNTWYALEVEYKLNTPGVADGTANVWVNGTQVYSNTAMNLRGSCSTPLSFFGFGDQAARYYYDVIDENRYFDNIAVSTSYIP